MSWVVHPMASESEGGPRRNIEITARIEGATYRAALGAHDGVLFAEEQSARNPSLRTANQLSVIHFVTMGPETIVARRTQPTLLEIVFTVEADDEPAKLHGTLATIPIPADAHVVDAIYAIGAGGEKRAIDCSSKKEEPWGPKSNGTGEGRAR